MESLEAEVQLAQDAVVAEKGSHVDPVELRAALADLELVWAELVPRERARVIDLLLEQVVFHAAEGELELTFRPGGPQALQEDA